MTFSPSSYPHIPLSAVLQIAVKGLGPKVLRNILQKLGEDGLARATRQDLVGCGVRGEVADNTARALADKAVLNEIYTSIDAALLQGGRIWTAADTAQLPGLMDLKAAPLCVVTNDRVDLKVLQKRRVGIVGTRSPSPDGEAFARELGREVARHSGLVISGAALGIDTAAHCGALEAGGDTLAVFGASLTREAESKRDWFNRLWKQAGVLTEQLLPLPIDKWMYPRRNRIIAALSEVVVVVEGLEKSGALITAREALAIKRRVLATPGRIRDPLAQAPNSLLAAGADACRGIDDILEALSQTKGAVAKPSGQGELMFGEGSARAPASSAGAGSTSSPPAEANFVETGVVATEVAANTVEINTEEKKLLTVLKKQGQAIHIDELGAALGKLPAEISLVLLQLELKKLCRKTSGGLVEATAIGLGALKH